MPSERLQYLQAHLAPLSVEPPRVTRDELRARLDSMPHGRLVDLVMDLTDADYELLVRVRRVVTAQHDVNAAVAHLRAEIDRTLAVRFVAWDEAAAFVTELDAVVGEIRTLARTNAKAAVDVALYFLEALPRVFDAVHGENELGMFAEEFAPVIISLASAAEMPFEEIAGRLLRAVAADGYGYFNDLPQVVRGSCTTPAMASATVRAAEAVVRQADGGGRWAVEALLRAMRPNGT